jgi:hypothetical protein
MITTLGPRLRQCAFSFRSAVTHKRRPKLPSFATPKAARSPPFHFRSELRAHSGCPGLLQPFSAFSTSVVQPPRSPSGPSCAPSHPRISRCSGVTRFEWLVTPIRYVLMTHASTLPQQEPMNLSSFNSSKAPLSVKTWLGGPTMRLNDPIGIISIRWPALGMACSSEDSALAPRRSLTGDRSGTDSCIQSQVARPSWSLCTIHTLYATSELERWLYANHRTE